MPLRIDHSSHISPLPIWLNQWMYFQTRSSRHTWYSGTCVWLIVIWDSQLPRFFYHWKEVLGSSLGHCHSFSSPTWTLIHLILTSLGWTWCYLENHFFNLVQHASILVKKLSSMFSGIIKWYNANRSFYCHHSPVGYWHHPACNSSCYVRIHSFSCWLQDSNQVMHLWSCAASGT